MSPFVDRRFGRSFLLATLAVASLGSLTIIACRGATEIALDVRTDVACTNAASWKGVAVYVGEPGVDVESKAPALTSTSCDANGQIGTLVVVPTGSNSGQVGLRVVAGLTRNPEDCAAAGYDGCIVARRTVDYLPHETQTVVIDLTSDCAGNACDVNHTCVDGACTDTVVAAAPVEADGGVVPSGPTVRCGDDGTRCPVGDPAHVCCVTTNALQFAPDASNTGTCMAAKDCPPTSATLYCDDSSQCAPDDTGQGRVCCENWRGVEPEPDTDFVTSGSACGLPKDCNGGDGEKPALCELREPCPTTGLACVADDHLNGYFTCFAQ